MIKKKSKPISIIKFLVFWMLAVYLLWPLMIIPTTILIYLLPPYPAYETLGNIYWYGLANKVIFVAVFTPAMAYVQAWLFKRLLFIRIPYWEIATITGGLIGVALMWFFPQDIPFKMLTWFAGIGIAQFLLLRPRIRNAWLWLLAQLCLSFFFPIYGSDWLIIVLKWLLASSAYGIATLFVLRELSKGILTEVETSV